MPSAQIFRNPTITLHCFVLLRDRSRSFVLNVKLPEAENNPANHVMTFLSVFNAYNVIIYVLSRDDDIQRTTVEEDEEEVPTFFCLRMYLLYVGGLETQQFKTFQTHNRRSILSPPQLHNWFGMVIQTTTPG